MGHIIITIGFFLAASVNLLGSLLFTKFFTSSGFFKFYPNLFGREGIISVMLWGFAYLSVSFDYEDVPWLILLFAFEKLFYVVTYALWIRGPGKDILKQQGPEDSLGAMWHSVWGFVDFVFMLFFLFVFFYVLFK